MGLVIDTCVFISIEREKKTHPVDFSQWSKHGEAYISTVTMSELLIGVHAADSMARQMKRAAFVETIIERIPALDFTAEVARIHAKVFAEISQKGQLIGAHDLIIGATALAHGYALLTKNLKEFKRIPGLEVLSI